jgi:hypothetical protein
MKRIAFVVLLAVLSFGCGKLREKLAGKAVEEGSSGQVNVSSGGVTVTTPTGTAQVGVGASLPDGWPSSVPVYPGARIQSSMGTPVGKTIIFTTTDSQQKVHDYYKSELKSFKLAADINANGATVLSFKDGAKNVAVNIANNTVTLSVTGF